jgi:N6-adenosine-specific RNA methylase IME4
MNSLVTQEKHLPSKIEDLSKFVLVGREKLTAVRAEIRAIDKIGLAKEVREQKRQEAQDLSEALLDAEARIGEILKSIPTTTNNQYTKNAEVQQCTKAKIIKDLGFEPTQAKRFETLAENKEIIEQVKAEARENEDIPTRTEVLNRVKKIKHKENISKQKEEISQGKAKLPEGVFEVISIDPPWNYGTQYDGEGRRVANPYPEMSQEELKELKIPSADNSVLFLWTTHKFLWNAKELLDYWGFTYRNIIVWDKEKMGMGDLFRMQCEFCIVGIKGKPIFDNNHTWRDIIKESRREHSRKPDIFYNMVNELCVGRKLDYFSREEKQGWEVFGNDTSKF